VRWLALSRHQLLVCLIIVRVFVQGEDLVAAGGLGLLATHGLAALTFDMGESEALVEIGAFWRGRPLVAGPPGIPVAALH